MSIRVDKNVAWELVKSLKELHIKAEVSEVGGLNCTVSAKADHRIIEAYLRGYAAGRGLA